MKWRILGSALSAGIVIGWLEMEHQLSWIETTGIGVVSAVLSILIWELGKSICCSYRKRNMFSICFVNQPPPDERKIDQWNPHPIPFGPSEHWLQVICSEGLRLFQFNVRFISHDETTRGPEEPLFNIEHIVRITEVHMMPKVLMQGIKSTMISDQKGGIDVILSPPLPIAAKEPFVLKLCVAASTEPWIGKISFRGVDNDGFRRIARKPCQVLDTITPAVIVPIIPDGTPSVRFVPGD